MLSLETVSELAKEQVLGTMRSNSGGCAKTYTVSAGDTCSVIAQQLGLGDWHSLMNLNPAINSQCTNLQIGQILCVNAGSGGGSPATPSNVLFRTSGFGTFYYDVKDSFCGSFPENNGFPKCTSNTPGAAQQTMQQINTDNIVAIGQLFGADEAGRAEWCGKKVVVADADGNPVSAPDGGDFFVWDGCQRCAQDNNNVLDFSFSGLKNVNPDACTQGKVPLSFTILNTQVMQFVP